ncbi:hypothetical protein [Microbacterium galbinum]|uniref:hypothetical protein n=1 Tax=Microbacterium galbinum TaxID=2851646 RepID=UPI001FFC5A1C|nr:hypothetical protein [Microbacterium galbinum]MCK2030316.1 hypothetical protein [Microbacterium galbinum]
MKRTVGVVWSSPSKRMPRLYEIVSFVRMMSLSALESLPAASSAENGAVPVVWLIVSASVAAADAGAATMKPAHSALSAAATPIVLVKARVRAVVRVMMALPLAKVMRKQMLPVSRELRTFSTW